MQAGIPGPLKRLGLLALFAGILAVPTAGAAPPVPTCAGALATIIGTPSADILWGTDGVDVIVARGGDDEIYALEGDDLVCGGGGDDLIVPGPGDDTVRGGRGSDTISFDDAAGPVQVQLWNGQASGQGNDTIRTVENVIGSVFDDVIAGDSGGNIIDGGRGNDDLTGRNGRDQLTGGQGRDHLRGGKADDTLDGGPGGDRFQPDQGDDAIVGGPGDDLLEMRSSANPVTVDIEAGSATGQGRDTLESVEDVAGTRWGDSLTGNSSDNILRGRAGDDTLVGGAGSDRLVGGNGSDWADGGPGDDQCRSTEQGPGCSGAVAVELVVDIGQGDPGLALSRPGDDRIFILDHGGRVLAWDGVALTTVLDITVSTGSEQGLLGMAFHPFYAVNDRWFVSYTDLSGDSVIAEVDPIPNAPGSLDDTALRTVLKVDQPAANHNGGMITFGPDGHLYIGLGDGGGGGDPWENGQDPTTMLGSMLRIDVDGALPYAVPPDNPFVGEPGADEIWAIGLRNPWRFSFDGDLLFIGDVGQSQREEVNVVPWALAGLDYGWNTVEGTACFDPMTGCSTAGTVIPAVDYDHGQGCSVIGGYVYRGSDLDNLQGRYIYGDFCGGWVRALVPGEGSSSVTELIGNVGPITSFGLDADGEVLVSVLGGDVFRLVSEG